MIENTKPKIFFSAAEVSGDKHAANLIKHLRQEIPHYNCQGLGGPAMEAAGCDLLKNLTDSSAMLTHAISQVGFYLKLLRQIKKHFATSPPQLVVLIDSPAWNFHVAKAARKFQIPVLYYIAPQLWAWGAWRTGKLRKNIDRLACILPFEQQWFRDRNIRTDYVGHPLFDDQKPIPPGTPDPRYFPTVALLPGSRSHEIDQLWSAMQKIARRIMIEYPGARFLTAVTNENLLEKLKDQADPSLDLQIRQTSIEAVTRHADLALVASGTATLEVAAQHCPMIVMYPVNRLHWHLAGRWLVKTNHISLVNILANKEIVPEYIPFGNRVNAVANNAISLLADHQGLNQTRIELEQLVKPIMQPGTAAKVTEIIKTMLPDV
jgi:lipid-A-disaccharide synthase